MGTMRPHVLGDWNELRRRDLAPGGMRPAQQRLAAGDGSRPEVDLRLVVQANSLRFQGAPQALLDGLPLDGPHSSPA
jgi:hypothetical protein